MDFSAIINFLKNAIAALLKLLQINVDEEAAEGFVDNVESGVKDVIDYGNSIA